MKMNYVCKIKCINNHFIWLYIYTTIIIELLFGKQLKTTYNIQLILSSFMSYSI